MNSFKIESKDMRRDFGRNAKDKTTTTMVDCCLQGDTCLKEVGELAFYVRDFGVQVHELRAGITRIPSGKAAGKKVVIAKRFVRVLAPLRNSIK